jgi:hypothetical protein
MTNTQTYLVVWRGTEDQFVQSEVDLGICDPKQMTNNEWVREASLTEGYSAEDAAELTENGYELILVCPMPEAFFDQ